VEILVVEDEATIADFLERGLSAEGHTVLTAADGIEGERMALDRDVDMVILDRMLPGRDGLRVLDGIRRARPQLPVILLTAKGEVADRVEGLDRGATDYVTKPFSLDELAARVRAHARGAEADETRLSAGGLELDLLSRRARHDGRSARLSQREADLLAHLMRHAGQVCTREDLLSSVWRYRHDPGTNVVQVYVGYLRARLRKAGLPAPIETVRAVGYRLTETP
jgi:two-component system OmpR family response regulator